MIKRMDKSTESVIGFEISGQISLEEFNQIVPYIEKALEKNEKISLLFFVESMKGYGIKEFAADVKFAIKYWDKISKLAVVSDHDWWGPAAKVDNFFTKWEERYFDASELDKAWEWILP